MNKRMQIIYAIIMNEPHIEIIKAHENNNMREIHNYKKKIFYL